MNNDNNYIIIIIIIINILIIKFTIFVDRKKGYRWVSINKIVFYRYEV